MKKVLGVLLMTISLASFASDKGNGGDPFKVYAEIYPDAKKLESALLSTLDKVQSSSFSDEFKQSIEDELFSLKVNESFMYLESLLIVQAITSDTYRLPEDLKTFTSLGAMTSPEMGAPIYLSKRTLSYSIEQLGMLLLHEILHHTLPETLSADERFVDDLVSAVWKQENVLTMKKALENNVYIVPGKAISIWQLFNSKNSKSLLIDWCQRPILSARASVDECEVRFAKMSDLLRDNMKHDNSDQSVYEIDQILGQVLVSMSSGIGSFASQAPNYLIKIARDLDYKVNTQKWSDLRCKKYTGNMFSRRCLIENQVKVKNIFF